MSDTAPSTGKKSLVSKLAAIIKDMERVPKNGRNEFQRKSYLISTFHEHRRDTIRRQCLALL